MVISLNSEIQIYLDGHLVEVFMQNGFFEYRSAESTIHNHRTFELHAMACGNAEFVIDGKNLSLAAGEMLVIEPEVFHNCNRITPDSAHIAFQIRTNLPIKSGVIKSPPRILMQILSEIDRYAKEGDGIRLKAYLMLICAEVVEYKAPAKLKAITDREFIISEFFAKNYAKNVAVEDLADELGVCKKQAERLVVKHTGNSFRTEITRKRMEIAELLYSEGVPLSRVAELVGYHTYSGFWRAYKNRVN